MVRLTNEKLGWSFPVLGLLILILPGQYVAAEPWRTEAKLTAGDPASGDKFGCGVSINSAGNTIVVGAPEHGEYEPCSGSAYVFRKNDHGNWIEATKLTDESLAANDRFGYSVGISGETVVVGAYGDRHPTRGWLDTGSAYVFHKTDAGWENVKLTAKLPGGREDTRQYAYFGWSVGINGDTIIVGAYGDGSMADGGLSTGGSAYVFEKNGSGAWVVTAKLTAEWPPGTSDAEALDSFGYSVSITNATAVVGAPYGDQGPTTNTGSAYVFKKTGGNWVVDGKLTASDAAVDDRFGESVSVSSDGNTVIVGAPSDDDHFRVASGSAYVFEKREGRWVQMFKLTAQRPDGSYDASAHAYFGHSVGISDDTVIIGAYGDDYNSATSDSGSAYVFERVVDGSGGHIWVPKAKLTAKLPADGSHSDERDDAHADAWFGVSVYLAGPRAVVGADRSDLDTTGDGVRNLANAGSVYVISTETPEPPGELVVDAGENQVIRVDTTAHLDGTVTLDGLDVSPDEAHWIALTGPAEVSFGDASAVDTTAGFAGPGSYLLQLTAKIGATERSDTVQVTVLDLPEGAFHAGSVIFSDVRGVLTEDNDHFFWDDASDELGIGTNEPDHSLHVDGDAWVQGPLRIAEEGNDYTLPTTRGSADQVLRTNGDGTADWATSEVGWEDVLDKPAAYRPETHEHEQYVRRSGDTMTGDLNVNAKIGISLGTHVPTRSLNVNGDAWLRGPLSIGEAEGYTLPTTRGSENQVLRTNGDGTTDWATSERVVRWEDVLGKPAAFPPETHEHDEYVRRSGDTMTGDLNVNAKIGISLGTDEPTHSLHVNGDAWVQGPLRIADEGNDYTLPTTRGSENQVLRTNGDGTTGWATSEVGWEDVLDKPAAYPPETHELDERYVRRSGDTMTGVLSMRGTSRPSPESGKAKIWAETRWLGVPPFDPYIIRFSELLVLDSWGNYTGISPHRFSLFTPDPEDPMPWSYYSKNCFLGKEINVDMSGAIRALEKLTGQRFIHIKDLPKQEREDWDRWKADETERLIREAKQREIEKDPWVEIPFGEAWEEVEETKTEQVVEKVSRHRINWATMKVERYEGRETRMEARPTGRKVKRLKEGIRFDEKTGKFYRRRTEQEVKLDEKNPPRIEAPKYLKERLIRQAKSEAK